MTLQPGQTVGRYQIIESLGVGGMATVYKAFQPSLEREVALKVLRAAFAEDPEFFQRFQREARSIARLRHPHIVQVFDFEPVDGRYILAMEFLEGGTLKERVTQLSAAGQRLPLGEITRLIGEVAAALSYGHQRGIVHRDVKPSNVMLAEGNRAVVTDFGIAKIMGDVGQTQTGVGIGTPEYMAPEQGTGAKVDHRADIYSLGVMAYEMLTGRVPYTADTPLAIVIAHIRDPLPLPSAVDPSVGPATERVLLRALAKEAVQRHDSATDFADALRDAIVLDAKTATVATMFVRAPAVAKGVAAIPARVTAELSSFPRPALLAILGALLITLAGGAALTAGAFRAAPAAPIAAPTATTSRQDPSPTAQPTRSATPTATLPAVTPRPTATLPGVTSTPRTAIGATGQDSGLIPPPRDPNAALWNVTGRVTSAVTGGPLAGVIVTPYYGTPYRCCSGYGRAVTDASGTYVVAVPTGTWLVGFAPAGGSGHAPMFWGGDVTSSSGRSLVVNGAPVSGVDAALVTGFLVSGRVTSVSGGPPPTISVISFHQPGASGTIGTVDTERDGTFSLRLPEGSYDVRFYRQSNDCCRDAFATRSVVVSGSDVTVAATMPPQ